MDYYAKCAVPESVSIFFFLDGLSSEVDHFPLLNFWMPVPSLDKRNMCYVFLASRFGIKVFCSVTILTLVF